MGDQTFDDAPGGAPALLTFALGTFNVLLLALTVVTIGYRDGWLSDALDGLNTALGVLAFAALWLLTWWAGARAVQGWSLDRPPPWPDLWGRGLLWGGAAGVVALLVPLVPALVLGLIEDGMTTALPTSIAIAVLFGFSGCMFAFIVGAAVGFVLATIDRCVLAIALRA